MTSRSLPAREAGFTLVELTVVISIIGILTSLATVMLKRDRNAQDVAGVVAGRIGECVRLAQMSGPVRPDVAETGITARVRLVVDPASGDQQTLTLARLLENELPAHTAMWEDISTVVTGAGIRIVGYRNEAVLTQGDEPTDLLGSTSTLSIECFPDGTTVARTLYLEGAGGTERARVAVLPLTGEALVTGGW